MAEVHDILEKYNFQSYHVVWLSVHPGRSPEWLKDKLRDGFDIHHVDGDHSNDDPNNLILIESVDHMRLHGFRLKDGINRWRKGSFRKPNPEDEIIYNMRRDIDGSWAEFAQAYYGDEKPRDTTWSQIGHGLLMKAKRFATHNSMEWPPLYRTGRL